MDGNALLLLGLLRMQSQHGYQLNEFIESNLARLTTMKKPTAYATLERLHREGYADVHTERQGNWPARKIYSITALGESRFFEMLRDGLSTTPLPECTADVALLFVDELPPPEASGCLRRRIDQLDGIIAMHERAPQRGYGVKVDLALEQFLVILRADRDWLATVLERFEGGPDTGEGASRQRRSS